MIDFIKLQISDIIMIDKVWNSPLLIYKRESIFISPHTGKRMMAEERTYKNLVFKRRSELNISTGEIIKCNGLDISGSLHTYFNNGLHNANDFYYIDVVNVIFELKRLFPIDLKAVNVVNLEFGCNIPLPFDVKEVVDGLLYQSKNKFINDVELRHSKKAGTHNDKGVFNKNKMIKAYAKGVQFPEYCDKNTFRFELKSCESRFINNFKIKTLFDLTAKEPYILMRKRLIKEWGDILLIDRITKFKDCKQSNNYLSDKFWEDKIRAKGKNTFSKNKNKHLKWLGLNPNNIYHSIGCLLSCKIDKLVSFVYSQETQKGDYSTHSQEPKGKGVVLTTKTQKGDYSNVGKFGKVPPREKRCIITGVDISMQRKDSRVLSHTGLKELHTNSPGVYDRIRQKYLSDRWQGISFKEEVRRLAHSIRNKKQQLFKQ